jgi:hypothetical protein
MSAVLTFSQPLNVSLQEGDTAYYAPTTTNVGSSGFNINASSIVEIGIVTDITGLVVTVTNNLVVVPNGSYILFSKDNKANLSSALGYYAECVYKNNSTDYSELFSVGVDTFGSSK